MKLEKKELERLQELNNDFTRMKLQLGEVEVQKSLIIDEVKKIKATFLIEEQKLIEKYGPDSVINLQTGEVTQSKKE
jgi:hypothetical protein